MRRRGGSTAKTAVDSRHLLHLSTAMWEVPGRQLAGVRVAVLRWDSRRRVRPHSGERGQPAPRMWGRARLLFTRKTLQLDLIGCGLSRIPAGTPARVARANGLLEATATYLVAPSAAEFGGFRRD